jgi:hypothetical protein
MAQPKRLIAAVTLALTMGALGTASGLTLRSALATENQPGTEIIGGGGCEQDECDGKTTCVQNPGQNTKCDVTGPGACATQAC